MLQRKPRSVIPIYYLVLGARDRTKPVLYYLCDGYNELHVTYRNASCIGNIQQSQPRIVHLFPIPFHTLLLQYYSPESAIRLLLVFLCTNSVDASYIGLYAGYIIPKQKTYGVLWTKQLVN